MIAAGNGRGNGGKKLIEFIRIAIRWDEFICFGGAVFKRGFSAAVWAFNVLVSKCCHVMRKRNTEFIAGG